MLSKPFMLSRCIDFFLLNFVTMFAQSRCTNRIGFVNTILRLTDAKYLDINRDTELYVTFQYIVSSIPYILSIIRP